jgi:prevent-host-death family protein
MQRIYSLTEAKAKFSEIVNHVHFRNERITITKKGKVVAVISPISEFSAAEKGEGLILASGALSEMDPVIDEMVGTIYENRIEETDREVEL